MSLSKNEEYFEGTVISQPDDITQGYRPYEPPKGTWKDGLCNCFSNLWPSCCCVFLGGYSGFCLPMYLAGQINTRVGGWITETTMKVFLAITALFYLLGLIVGAATDNTAGTVFLFYFPYVYAFFFLIYLRFKFVGYYGIRENCLETFCIAFWCTGCSLCQMARHTYGYSKVLDGDAQPDARQVYTHIPV